MQVSGYAFRTDTVIGHVELYFLVFRHFVLGCCSHIVSS